ncbi:hypothetical protein IV203_004296 [Nitzschia inconspicua]|uniref:Uncharacterized protein n=1 Tax=Nitzschia inconspicua TaxID=303405 RepID=A0A9K3PP68_9STRA|nr:hypothetical protein IV203_004296 [Nitzschia inconspicua]
MEDRHYLSEPRPVAGLDIPTWEVDIMREGVDDPIMTLLVDQNSLPPRKSKKKIVWKLPDNLETLPKFGIQDKKRILEIYKEKKKEAKKQIRRASRKSSPSPSSEHPADVIEVAKEVVAKELNLTAMKVDTINTNGHEKRQMSPNKSIPSSESSSTSSPPGLETLSLDTTPSAASEKPHNTFVSTVYSSDPRSTIQESLPPPPPPPGIHPRPPPGIFHQPPPGIATMHSVTVPETPSGAAITNASTSQPSHTHHHPHSSQGVQPFALGSPSLHMPLQSVLPLQSLPPSLPPSGRCFVLPSAKVSQFTSTHAALAAIASLVSESYHLLLHRGLINELASYYALDAQKSLTVGGAYAACASAADRLLQLKSLSGTIKPHIKGIQQQPTLGGGIMTQTARQKSPLDIRYKTTI